MMYYSTIIFAGADILPRTSLEIIITTIFLLVSAIVNASVYGNFATLTYKILLKSVLLEEDIENMNEAMSGLKISNALREEVRNHVIAMDDPKH